MSRLEKLVADVCMAIKELSPETRVAVSYEPFEDVDATIRVYPSTEETGESINEMTLDRTWDILVDEGYHISVLVHDPDGVEPTEALVMAA